MIDKIIEYAKSIQVKSYDVVSEYKEGYLGKRVYNVLLENGRTKEVERLLKDGEDGNAVVIIPFTKDGKVIIEVQSRPNMVDSNGIAVEFPAGMVDKNEEFVKAAERELLEETGYTAEEFKELEWHYQDQGCSNAIIKTYIATNCFKNGKQELDPDEVLEPLEVTFEELMELFHNKMINDASSKLAILYYLDQNKKA